MSWSVIPAILKASRSYGVSGLDWRPIGASEVNKVIWKQINCSATIGLVALVNNDSILEFEQSSRNSHVCLSIDQLQQYSGTGHYDYTLSYDFQL